MIPRGFEPRTHSLEGCCSIQLSYETIIFLKFGCNVASVFLKFGCNVASVFSNSRAKVLLFFEMCKFFVFIFFACAQGLRGKKPKKHPSRRIVTLSGPLAVAVSLCNCKQAFIAPTAITITYQGRPIQRRAKTPARAQRRPKKQLLRTKTKTKTKTFYVSQQYSRTRNMFFKFGTN